MSDFYLRLFLFCTLVFIGLLWNFTTPQNFQKYLLLLPKPKNWLILSFQIIPFLQLFNVINLTWPRNQLNVIFIIIGTITLLTGLFIACWAKLTMKNNWGRPGQHDLKIQKSLVISGPFRLTRNPIYLGLLLVFLGFELTMHSYLIILSIPLYYLMTVMINKEEILLTDLFGQKYLDYKKSIPRFINLNRFK
jgi:protein-S-isoprenylcysteine O-methyltransferase Ste14